MLDATVLDEVYGERKPHAHKGSFGRLVVIAGSERYTGSPCFTCMSAYRAGCDLVYLLAPGRPADVAASFNPSIIAQPLEGKMLGEADIPYAETFMDEVRADAVVIGPGLGRGGETVRAVRALVAQIDVPMVIDADAIGAVSTDPSVLSGKRVVLTPHAGELRTLLGGEATVPVESAGRQSLVEETADDLDVTIILKGSKDIISDGSETRINDTGNPYMTKGGCGDTLAGVCGAFMARGAAPIDAASAAAYLNGLAGDIAADVYGEGMLATDLLDAIPRVLVDLHE